MSRRKAITCLSCAYSSIWEWRLLFNRQSHWSHELQPDVIHSRARDGGEIQFSLHLIVNLLNMHFSKLYENWNTAVSRNLHFLEFFSLVFQSNSVYQNAYVRGEMCIKISNWKQHTETHYVRENSWQNMHISQNCAQKVWWSGEIFTKFLTNFHEMCF